MKFFNLLLLLLIGTLHSAWSFVPSCRSVVSTDGPSFRTDTTMGKTLSSLKPAATTALQLSSNKNDYDNNNNRKKELEQTFGGYTVKQRLREEVESPFRTVRLYFFGFSTISALIAFYFSLLTLGKAMAGGFVDAPPVDDAITSVVINVLAILICGGISYRDIQAGEANLARIKQGGALASLVVERADETKQRATLADFRRNSRVLIAAGNKKYIETLCKSLNADQLKDENTLPQAIMAADLMIIPVLLEPIGGGGGGKGSTTLRVGDTATAWTETKASEEIDRNFDVSRSNAVLAFPKGPAAWAEVLEYEAETATKQGFNVFEKGITFVLKKNGKILRRATGQPQWSGILGTMDVLDGQKFGMPGDDAIYGSGNA